MSYQFPADIRKLVRGLMASGDYASEDDLLRAAMLSLYDAIDDDLAAVQEALMELDAGDPGVELDEAFRQVRKKCGIESDV